MNSNENYQKPESTYLIRFSDCDPFNHLNNAKYIDYFLNAREDHLSEYYDFKVHEYAKTTGKSWVVAQNQIVYLSPAILMEKVMIQTQIIEWNTSDILVEMNMWDENKNKLKALLWTRFVHIDLNEQKRTKHAEELNTQFALLECKFEKKMSFDERILEMRKIKDS